MPLPVAIPAGSGTALPAAANAIAPFIRGGAVVPPLPVSLPSALAPAVPALSKSGAGIGLLLSFGAGYAVGTWLWNLFNDRSYQDQVRPPLDPTKPGRQEGTGEYSNTAVTNYKLTGTVDYRNPNTGQIVPGRAINWQGNVSVADSAANPAWIEMRGPQNIGGVDFWGQLFVSAADTRPPLGAPSTGGPYNNPKLQLVATTSGSDRIPMPGSVPLPPTEPDPNWEPEPLPEILPLPTLPEILPIPLPQPGPAPAPLPEQPEPLPEAPPAPDQPIAPPIAPPVAPPITTPKPTPLPPQPARPPQPTLPDGTPEPEPEPPPVTRPPGVETVPGGEIGQPGTQPRPDLEGIAAELGKLEQKLRLVLEANVGGGGGGEPDPAIAEILAILKAPYQAGEFALFPVCETDGNGTPLPPMVTTWPAGTGPLGELSKKLDGVAELLQFAKELRQPVCKRAPFGEEVTVNFREDLETATRATPLRKVLRYRDRSGKDVAGHVAHWEGFAWQAGPVIVAANGPWGEVQVWASSEGEGRRVVRHALNGGGWDPDGEPGMEWLVTTSKSSRVGQTGLMRVELNRDGVRVTKRRGSDGRPPQIDPD